MLSLLLEVFLSPKICLQITKNGRKSGRFFIYVVRSAFFVLLCALFVVVVIDSRNPGFIQKEN